jgi:hypothetical protein
MFALSFLVAFVVFVAAVSADYADGAWRKSLDGKNACWTDRNCQRVMTCAHGGEWNVTFPYDSFPAFQQAYIDGADAIKGGKNFYSNIIFRAEFIEFGVTRFSCCKGQYWGCHALKVCKFQTVVHNVFLCWYYLALWNFMNH